MDNATEAIKMSFGFMVFVIAMSLAIYLLTIASSTSQVLLYMADKTNYYDNIAVTNLDSLIRDVNYETIIPTLYRYYKENFAVQIFDQNGKLIQIFDVNIEGKVYNAIQKSPTARSNEERALIQLYGVPSTSSNLMPDLFQAPWNGHNEDIKTRIDLYINGKVGYINGTKVDYTQNYLKKFKDKIFEEQFVEYMYKGDTITVGRDEGEDAMETITGNTKPENKIIISYRMKDRPTTPP